MRYGYEEGETCNRTGCAGIIQNGERSGCSCHISPPCPSCTEDVSYCPVCDWHGRDDEYMNGYRASIDKKTGTWRAWEPRKLDTSKIDFYRKPHSSCSMIMEGVYPEGTTQAEVLKEVEGTFGGRFEYFGGGKFKYVAYTD